jgi:hypothetical protein
VRDRCARGPDGALAHCRPPPDRLSPSGPSAPSRRAARWLGAGGEPWANQRGLAEAPCWRHAMTNSARRVRTPIAGRPVTAGRRPWLARGSRSWRRLSPGAFCERGCRGELSGQRLEPRAHAGVGKALELNCLGSELRFFSGELAAVPSGFAAARPASTAQDLTASRQAEIGKRGSRSKSDGAALVCSSRLTTDSMLPVMALPERNRSECCFSLIRDQFASLSLLGVWVNEPAAVR